MGRKPKYSIDKAPPHLSNKYEAVIRKNGVIIKWVEDRQQAHRIVQGYIEDERHPNF